jgi:hypothetical protein
VTLVILVAAGEQLVDFTPFATAGMTTSTTQSKSFVSGISPSANLALVIVVDLLIISALVTKDST